MNRRRLLPTYLPRARRSIDRALSLLAGAIAALLMMSTLVHAHARLDRSSPAADSRVQSAPSEVSITFTQAIEPAFSSITVTDSTGKRIDKNDTGRVGSNTKALRVSLQPLSAGTYKVQWRVLSVDSHKTEGEFTFSVAK